MNHTSACLSVSSSESHQCHAPGRDAWASACFPLFVLLLSVEAEMEMIRADASCGARFSVTLIDAPPNAVGPEYESLSPLAATLAASSQFPSLFSLPHLSRPPSLAICSRVAFNSPSASGGASHAASYLLSSSSLPPPAAR